MTAMLSEEWSDGIFNTWEIVHIWAMKAWLLDGRAWSGQAKPTDKASNRPSHEPEVAS